MLPVQQMKCCCILSCTFLFLLRYLHHVTCAGVFVLLFSFDCVFFLLVPETRTLCRYLVPNATADRDKIIVPGTMITHVDSMDVRGESLHALRKAIMGPMGSVSLVKHSPDFARILSGWH